VLDIAMKRFDSSYAKDRPARRPLKIFSTDPMRGRAAGNFVSIDVPNEELRRSRLLLQVG
jgi:hypothetical protein